MKLKAFLQKISDQNDEARDCGGGTFIDIFEDQQGLSFFCVIQDGHEQVPQVYWGAMEGLEQCLTTFRPTKWLSDAVHEVMRKNFESTKKLTNVDE